MIRKGYSSYNVYSNIHERCVYDPKTQQRLRSTSKAHPLLRLWCSSPCRHRVVSYVWYTWYGTHGMGHWHSITASRTRRTAGYFAAFWPRMTNEITTRSIIPQHHSEIPRPHTTPAAPPSWRPRKVQCRARPKGSS